MKSTLDPNLTVAAHLAIVHDGDTLRLRYGPITWCKLDEPADLAELLRDAARDGTAWDTHHGDWTGRLEVGDAATDRRTLVVHVERHKVVLTLDGDEVALDPVAALRLAKDIERVTEDTGTLSSAT